MEIIILTTASILVITAIIWLTNKILIRFSQQGYICPVCVGVSGTWLLMLAGVLWGFLPAKSFQLPIGVLMGGSVVGIAYQIDKRLPASRSLLWKILFIPAGFALALSVLSGLWILAGVLLFFKILLLLAFIFCENHQQKNKKVKFLEKQINEKCC